MRVRRYDWIPEGTTVRDSPAFIFTFSDNREMVMAEVVEEAPDYPVAVRTIGCAMYGNRARRLEIRHAHLRDYRERKWWDVIQCRLEPK